MGRNKSKVIVWILCGVLCVLIGCGKEAEEPRPMPSVTPSSSPENIGEEELDMTNVKPVGNVMLGTMGSQKLKRFAKAVGLAVYKDESFIYAVIPQEKLEAAIRWLQENQSPYAEQMDAYATHYDEGDH